MVGYKATQVACGWAGGTKQVYLAIWAGAVMQISPVNAKKIKQVKRARTDCQTERPTDGWTKQDVESRSSCSTRLKTFR